MAGLETTSSNESPVKWKRPITVDAEACHQDILISSDESSLLNFSGNFPQQNTASLPRLLPFSRHGTHLTTGQKYNLAPSQPTWRIILASDLPVRLTEAPGKWHYMSTLPAAQSDFPTSSMLIPWTFPTKLHRHKSFQSLLSGEVSADKQHHILFEQSFEILGLNLLLQKSWMIQSFSLVIFPKSEERELPNSHPLLLKLYAKDIQGR